MELNGADIAPCHLGTSPEMVSALTRVPDPDKERRQPARRHRARLTYTALEPGKPINDIFVDKIASAAANSRIETCAKPQP